MVDVAIAGGGPAGLAFAIAAARAHLRVVVFERRRAPVDKACGEGILPRGLAAIESFAVRELIDPLECAPLDGVRFLQAGGCAEARFSRPALGVRRTALVTALRRRALGLTVELRDECAVRAHEVRGDAVLLDTDAGPAEARLLVVADGLASPLRRRAGLERPSPGARRFGVRRHFHVAPWSRFVEVHFADGVECYLTPSGRERVGVAFLWEPRAGDDAGFEALLARFPAVQARVAGAAVDSAARGAGPMARAAVRRVADRLLLAGDAAGYIDAISGEGLSLAFACALDLGPLLPRALAGGASAAALSPYEAIFARHFRRYAVATRALLSLARRPPLRRAVVGWLSRHPRVFEAALAWAAG